MNTFSHDPVAGMQEAVAWVIEKNLQRKNGKIQASLDSITENGAGFTVEFNVNGSTLDSIWIKEYGLWRIHTFGDLTSGDKSLAAAREDAREQEKDLRTKYHVMLSLMYTLILDRGPAVGAVFKAKDEYLSFHQI
jgi:hypothetical protein